MATVVVNRHADALAFLKLLDDFPELPEPGSLAMTAVAGIYEGHPTHWIVAFRFQGFDLPEDNGLAVHCMPKAWFTHDQIKRRVGEMIGDANGEVLVDSTDARRN